MRTYFCPKCGRDLPVRMGLFQLTYVDRIAACEVCNPSEPETTQPSYPQKEADRGTGAGKEQLP